MRIEQLYPLHEKKINFILNKYFKRDELFWAQEEPENMGAWGYILKKLRKFISNKLSQSVKIDK